MANETHSQGRVTNLPTGASAPLGLQHICNQIHLLNDIITVIQLHLHNLSPTKKK